MLPKPGNFLPVVPAIRGAEHGGIFHAGVNRVRIVQGRFKMPDALEFPGMRRAVIPLVSARDAIVDKLVPHRLPGLAAIIGTLDLLTKPAAGLRGIEPVRLNGGALQMIDFPASQKRTADIPLFTFAV